MVKGMTTCKVCGRDFPLIVENHYTARDNEKSDYTALLSGNESTLYDIFDCPHCGCQNVMQERKREFTESTDNTTGRDGCEGCKYEYRQPEDYPCSECAGNYKDMYEVKEDEDGE